MDFCFLKSGGVGAGGKSPEQGSLLAAIKDGGNEEFLAVTFFSKILLCCLASNTLPLISLCTMSAACKKDTPSRICLVYFLVKLSFRAPCCLI